MAIRIHARRSKNTLLHHVTIRGPWGAEETNCPLGVGRTPSAAILEALAELKKWRDKIDEFLKSMETQEDDNEQK